MVKAKVLVKFLLLVLVSRLGFLALREFRGFWWLSDVDRYTQYAQALFTGSIHTILVREYIFPGFPMIIAMVHGLIPDWGLASIFTVLAGDVIGFALIATVFSPAAAMLALFFPPAFVWATSKIYSEGAMLGLLYGSLLLWKNKHYRKAIFLSGLSILVRPIGVTLVFAYFISFLKDHPLRKAISLLWLGLTPIVFLVIYNFFIWGNPLYNLESYQIGGTGIVPLVSVWENFVRLVRDENFRTLFSGSFYILLTISGTVVLGFLRNKSRLHYLAFVWALVQLIFLFTIGPASFFEDYGRYASFIYPLVFWGYFQLTKLKVPRWVYPLLWLGTVLLKNT